MAGPAPFNGPLSTVGHRLDELRLFVSHLDGLHAQAGRYDLTKTSRAWAFIALGAALEQFVKDWVDEMADHINRANVPLVNLRLGLISLTQAGAFDSVAAGRRQDMWDRRAAILQASAGHGTATLVSGLRPLDGRTIGQWHLNSIWTVYELPGQPLPSPLHGLALKDLTEGRNEVAHGNTAPTSFGGQKTYADVRRRIDQIEDIALHMGSTAEAYVLTQGFLR